MIDGFTRGGMPDWNEFCRYATIEAFGSPDPTKITAMLAETMNYIAQGVNDKAITNLSNLSISFNNALKLENPRQKSFACLVKSINGESMVNEPVDKIFALVKDMPVAEMENKLESAKKKSKRN